MEFSSLPVDGGDDGSWGPKLLTALAELRDGVNGNVSKGELVFNVKDYGAKGDGSTDDTAAFAAAEAAVFAAGGGTIYAPPGTYVLVHSSVTWQSTHIVGAAPTAGSFSTATISCAFALRAGVSFLGAGPGATILSASGGIDEVVALYDYNNGSVGGFSIQGAGSSNNVATGIGHEASAPRLNKDILLHDLEVSNVGSYGIGHQYGQPANYRVQNVHIHDVGADGIDWKARYGPADFLQQGSQGVVLDNILVERFGNRLTDTSGIDVRGQANLSNIVVRDFGRTDGILTGVTLSAGIVNGVDQRSGSGKTVLDNFHIEGNRGKQCIGVDILSGGSQVVGQGTVRNCAESTAGGIRVRALSTSPYGFIPGPVINGVVVEGSRGVPGVLVERDGATVVGVKVISDIQTFDARRGNINAGQTVFTLWTAIDANTVVNKNGVALVAGTGYTTSGTTLTLTAAATGTDVIDVIAKGSSSVYISGLYATIVGVSTDGYTPGVKFSGASTKTTGTVAGISGAINDPSLYVGNSAGSVEVTVTNAGAANVDLRLNPGNAGNVRFGTWTTSADAPVTGYVTIKDAAGATRKLAVIS